MLGPPRIVSLVFWITVIGGVGLALSSLARLPAAVVVASLALFLGGAVVVVVLSAADARRRDIGVGTAVWHGVRQGLRWIWAFMP